MTEPTEAPAAEKRRGRPRPAATIERDQAVWAQLEEPKNKKQLTEALPETKPSEIYLSIYRLRTQGLIQKQAGNAHTWERVPGAELPVA